MGDAKGMQYATKTAPDGAPSQSSPSRMPAPTGKSVNDSQRTLRAYSKSMEIGREKAIQFRMCCYRRQVVMRKFAVYGKPPRWRVERSLGVLASSNPLRQFTLSIVEHNAFDGFILALIGLNSLMLAITPLRETDTPINDLANSLDMVFLGFFIMEAVLKILSWGFVNGPGTYLQDYWNWLDFTVVVAGIVSIIPDVSSNISFLRVFRTLRPLRSLSVSKGMRKLVNTVLLSVPALANVAGMAFFIMVAFGILGTTFWAGVLHNRCMLTEFPVHATVDGARVVHWVPDPEQIAQPCGGRYECAAGTWCGNPHQLPAAYTGPPLTDPTANDPINEQPDLNFGLTTFDSIEEAFLIVFQSITLEGWVDIMYLHQAAHSDVFAAIYFALFIVIGAFFLLNVVLAVVWEAFQSLSEKEGDAGAEESEDEADAGPRRGSQASIRSGAPRSSALAASPRHAPQEPASGGSRGSRGSRNGEAEAGPPEPETRPTLFKDQVRRYGGGPRGVAKAVTESEPFQLLIMGIITLNVVALSLDTYPPPGPQKQQVLDAFNLVFTFVFLFEMIILHTADGLKKYWLNPVTAFDGVIVSASMVEFFLEGNSAVTALRAFRLLRIFKLAKKWTSFRLLLKAIVSTVMQMGNFIVLLLLTILVFSLMGMEFFGTNFRFEDDVHVAQCDGGADDWTCVPRAHFDDFLSGFVTIFQILSGENWNTVMYDGMRATGWHAVIYFVLLVVIGNSIILNLFLAILMSNFEEQNSAVRSAEAKKKQKVQKKKKEAEKKANAVAFALRAVGGTQPQQSKIENFAMEIARRDAAPELSNGHIASEPATERVLVNDRSFFVFSRTNPVRRFATRVVNDKNFDQAILVSILISSIAMAFDVPLLRPESLGAQVLNYMNLIFTVVFTIEMLLKQVSMGCFLNSGSYWRVSWNILDGLVVIVALVTLLPFTAGLESLKALRLIRALRPLRMISRNENLKLVVSTLFNSVPELLNLAIVGALFFLIFGLFGLSYFKGGFMTCVGGPSYHDDGVAYQPSPPTQPYGHPEDFDPGAPALCLNAAETQVFTLRRVAGAANCTAAAAQVHAAHPALWPEPAASAVSADELMLKWSTADAAAPEAERRRAGEVCVDVDQLLWKCSACPQRGGYACRTLYRDGAICSLAGYTWAIQHQNFDSIGNAMRTLFEISTTESWVDVMYSATDMRDVMLVPQRDYHPGWSLFFVLFILFGSFFILNLVVGVVIDNFSRIKAEGQSALLTPAQEQWLVTQRAFLARKLFFPLVGLKDLRGTRRRAAMLVLNPRFDHWIMICIGLNTVLLALRRYPDNDTIDLVILVGNYIFAAIFTFEAAIKIYALRGPYFQDNWNNFDFICVCATLFAICFSLALDSEELGPVVSVVRIFRIARIFRLVRFAKGLNKLFNAFLLTLPKLANVAVLLVLLLCLYAVLGVHLFGKTRFIGTHDVNANFQDVYRALITLLRCMTGEAFNELMHDLSKDEEYYRRFIVPAQSFLTERSVYEQARCIPDFEITASNYDRLQAAGQIAEPLDCGSVASMYYFISFTMAVTFVVFNLVIAVVLEGFDDAGKGQEQEIIDTCIELWQKYDPQYDLFLDLHRATAYVSEVNQITKQRKREKEAFAEGMTLSAAERAERAVDGENSVELNALPVKLATFINFPVTKNNEVYFLHCVQAALKLLVAEDDPALMDEIQKMQDEEVTAQGLRRHLVRVPQAYQKTAREMLAGEYGQFEQQIAAAKIQLLLRQRKERIEARLRNEKKRAELDAKRAQNHQAREARRARSSVALNATDAVTPAVSGGQLAPPSAVHAQASSHEISQAVAHQQSHSGLGSAPSADQPAATTAEASARDPPATNGAASAGSLPGVVSED